MRIYVSELPKSCNMDDCPFNYDTIGCRAMSAAMSNEAYDSFVESTEYDIISEYLHGKMGRYPKCPLYLLKLEKASEV